MLAAARRTRWGALLLAAAVLIASSGYANPLGLSYGDEITSIEWDAKQTNGEGATFTVPDEFLIDGSVNSVTIAGPSTIVQSNVDFLAELQYTSEALNFVNNPIVWVNVVLGSPGANPDVVITENGLNVLLGNFTTSVIVRGNLDISDDQAVLTGIGRITINGGDPDLVNALGGAGSGQANLLMTFSAFDFNPSAAILLNLPNDNLFFNSNFALSLSGTLIPLSPEPFVPEPSTALLVGGGLIVLIGVSRRARARRA
jgi:hypothetical protein